MNSGGKTLAQALAAQGVTRIFCVAGESYLPVLDALLDYPEIKVITCRHESGAAFMAEADGNLTGEVGMVMVTRGPGACNASISVHAGKQSSAPMIMFVGLVSTADEGKEAFQEFDLPQMFGSHAKWAAVIKQSKDIPSYVTRAFEAALSGRRGPVVLGLPEDILFGEGPEAAISKAVIASLKPPRNIAKLSDFLRSAQRPLIIAGGEDWSQDTHHALEKFSEATNIPVACAFRRQDAFSNMHSNYIGELGTGPNPTLVKRVKEADVILALGARIDEMTTQGYTLFQEGQTLIHTYPSREVFSKSYKPALAIEGSSDSIIATLTQKNFDGQKWVAWRDAGRAEYLSWTDIKPAVANWNGADMTQIFRQLREVLPNNSIVTTDAGNFSGWCQRYIRYGRPGRLLAPISGAMGYNVPAAIAASLAFPGRCVVGFCGDGGFMMTGQELATAMRYNATPIIFVCNNNMYGTIRMHQEREYPGRISATTLTNPDFVALAQSYGAFGARIENADEFMDVWNAARESKRAALIEIKMDPRQITTNAKSA